MANGVNAPRGLQRINSKLGAMANDSLSYYDIDPDTTFSLRQGDPVSFNPTTGTIDRWTNIPLPLNPAAVNPAQDGNELVSPIQDCRPICGIFNGVTYYDVNNKYTYSQSWIAGTSVFKNTVPRAIVNDNPYAVYSIQTSISNAQTFALSAVRYAVATYPVDLSGATVLDPLLGATSDMIGKTATIRLGGDPFNAGSDVPWFNPGIIFQPTTYTYPATYNPANTSVQGTAVANNPTDVSLDGAPVGVPSGYYLDVGTVVTPVGSTSVDFQALETSTWSHISPVRIVGLDDDNEWCAGPSTSTGPGAPFATAPSNWSFNNVKVTLDVTSANACAQAAPRYVARGRIPAELIPGFSVPSATPALNFPVVGPIPYGTILFHSATVKYTGGPIVTSPTEGGALALVGANIASYTTAATSTQYVYLQGGTGALLPTSLVNTTGWGSRASGESLIAFFNEQVEWLAGGTVANAGIKAPINALAFLFTGTGSFAGDGYITYEIEYSITDAGV